MTEVVAELSSIKSLSLEMGYQCNIRCSFCYQEHYSAKDNMPREIWEHKLAPLYKSIEHLTFLGGEPTVIKGAKELAAYVINQHPHIKLRTITNGICFDREWAKAFVNHGDKVIISVNASTEATYNKIHARGKWNKLKDNLAGLKEAKEKQASRLLIEGSFVLTDENVRDAPGFVTFGVDHGFDKVFFLAAIGQRITKEKSELVDILEEIQCKQAACGIRVEGLRSIIMQSCLAGERQYISCYPDNYPDEYYHAPCRYPWMNLNVMHDGRASVCCYSWLNLDGNLRGTSLEHMWNGRTAKRMRKQISQGNYRLCKRNCTLNENPGKRKSDSKTIAVEKIIKRFMHDPGNTYLKIRKELPRLLRGRRRGAKQ